MTKKILLFSPPFSGHLNPLKNLISKYRTKFNFHLAITGWTNIVPDLSGIRAPITILAESALRETDPALWTFPRVAELLDKCVALAEKLKPDLIIYDFFSLEGNLAGKKLGIPYWCSIPALIGPFIHQKYLQNKLRQPKNLKALEILKKSGTIINPRALEMISDGLHLPGKLNLVWSYPAVTPKEMMENRHPAKYIFVGSLVKPPKAIHTKRPLVYLSFGTVVMDNLWNQLADIRGKLKKFIGALAKLSANRQFDVLFVNRGKPILKKYPANWQITPFADQAAALARAAVFITHGGGNSFHEAINARVPMVVVPFFGDQPLVATQAKRLGIGINMIPKSGIDTKKPKDFLNEALARRIDAALHKILHEQNQYKKRFAKLKLKAEDVGKLLRK